MDRRRFVSHVAGLLSLALGAEGLTGCATVGATRQGPGPDPRAVVADWDAQVARLHRHGVPRGLRAELARAGLSPTLIEDGFASLLVTASFRDLPREVQRDPVVQARLHQELPVVADSVLGLTRYLEGLPARTRRGLGRHLRGDDRPTALLRAEVEQVRRRGGVAPARIAQTLDVLDHLDFRLRRQEPGLVIDDTVRKVDKAVARVGGDRAAWSPASRAQGRGTLRRPSELSDDELIDITEDTGAWVLALGGLISVGGLVTAYGSAVFGRSAVALFGVAVWTFGSLVFVLGLVVLITAAMAEDVSRLGELRD